MREFAKKLSNQTEEFLDRYVFDKEAELYEDSISSEIELPFEWGLDHLGLTSNDDPLATLKAHVESVSKLKEGPFTMDEKFADISSFSDDTILFQSPRPSNFKENNIVPIRLHPAGKERSKNVAIILGHWSSNHDDYLPLFKLFKLAGVDVAHVTLPYHDVRTPESFPYPYPIACPNIGLTLSTFQQAVLDVRVAIKHLKNLGYENFGIKGVSLGASVGSVVAALEDCVTLATFTFLGSCLGDVIYKSGLMPKGKLTVEEHLSYEDAKNIFLPWCSMYYFDHFNHKNTELHFHYGKNDIVLPTVVRRRVLKYLKKSDVKFTYELLPHGHFTLGQFPWNYMWGIKMANQFRQHFYK